MFKKSGAFVLTLLYTVTVMGFALNLHYCFNRITAVNINSPVKNSMQQTAGKMKCCRDKHIEVKVKDAHQGESQSFLSKIFGVELPKFPFADFFNSLQQSTPKDDFDRSPPNPPFNSLVTFLKNCVFRI